MTDEIGFVWTFPCYMLIGRHNRDTETGDLLLDSELQFVTPEITPGGEKHLLVFTDADLAEDFRSNMTEAAKYGLGRFSTAEQLREFVVAAAPYYRILGVDLNRKTRAHRSFVIAELIPELDRYLADRRDQDSQD